MFIAPTAELISIASMPTDRVTGNVTDGGQAQPLRVLLVAEHASLAFGGEASLAYYYFKLLLRRGVDVSMVVHERTRSELTRDFPEHIDRISFISDTRIHRLLWGIQSKLPRKLGEQTLGVALHLYNQLITRRQVRRVIPQKQIQIVHETMPISPKATSVMFGLGVPVVIGPMCGGMDYPPAFQYLQGGFSRFTERFGRRISHGVHRLVPGKLKAESLVVASQATLRALPKGMTGKIYTVVESGADLDIWKPQAINRTDTQVRFTFLGRLVDWKGVDVLLEAFKQVADSSPAAVLQIGGDGPLRQSLEARAKELAIAPRVRFLGHVSRAAAFAKAGENEDIGLADDLGTGGAGNVAEEADARGDC